MGALAKSHYCLIGALRQPFVSVGLSFPQRFGKWKLFIRQTSTSCLPFCPQSVMTVDELKWGVEWRLLQIRYGDKLESVRVHTCVCACKKDWRIIFFTKRMYKYSMSIISMQRNERSEAKLSLSPPWRSQLPVAGFDWHWPGCRWASCVPQQAVITAASLSSSEVWNLLSATAQRRRCSFITKKINHFGHYNTNWSRRLPVLWSNPVRIGRRRLYLRKEHHLIPITVEYLSYAWSIVT